MGQWARGLRAGQFLVLGAKVRALLQGRAACDHRGHHALARPCCATVFCSTIAPRPKASPWKNVIERLLIREAQRNPLCKNDRELARHEHASQSSQPGALRLRREGRTLIDPQTLMSIKNLELRAAVVVEVSGTGCTESVSTASRFEFSEYGNTPGRRSPLPGLELYARGPLFHQEIEDEPICAAICSSIKAVDWITVRSATPSPIRQTPSPTLAYFLYLQGDAVGLLTFDESIRITSPRASPRPFAPLDAQARTTRRRETTDLTAPLLRAVRTIKKRALLVLVSDLLAPIGALEKNLTAWAPAV